MKDEDYYYGLEDYGYKKFGQVPETEEVTKTTQTQATQTIFDFLTEISRLSINKDQILIVKIKEKYMEEGFISDLQKGLVHVFGADFIKEGRIMIVPEGVDFQLVDKPKKHPVYGDSNG